MISTMTQSLLLLLLSITTSLVSGFGTFVLPSATATATTVAFAATRTAAPLAKQQQQQCSSSALSGSNNNIFQDYTNKPIVLLGTSSEHDELNRLAQSLSKKLGTNVIDAFRDDDAGAQQETNVLVLDFKSDNHAELAKSLYQDSNLLSIYINVLNANNNDSDDSDNDLENDIFVPFSDYELCIKDEGSATNTDNTDNNAENTDGNKAEEWLHLEWELLRLVARALLPPATPGSNEPSINTAHLTMGEHSFFLSLSFPDITQVKPYIPELCADVDAMEYRTDLLDCRDSRFDLIYGQQLLRMYCKDHAYRAPALPVVGKSGIVMANVFPIVYTVRTQNQAGTYPDDEAGIARMFEMLEWGLRSGVEVLDVESAWDEEKTAALLTVAKERYSTQILGSHHVVGTEVPLEDAVSLFQQCGLDGRAHGAKVVLSIDSEDKDKMAYQAALISQSLAEEQGLPVIPSLSLILGDVGQFSRVINLPFTPVTHELLPLKAAPGQLTASEIMTCRLLTKIISAQKYCILGHNIDYSVSPQMHNAAFAAVRLPYQYARADVATVEEFIDSDFFKGSAFSGASVTIPHKQSIMKYVDVMSDAAKAIGSVNTLVTRETVGEEEITQYLYGDNTDWKGIFNPLSRILVAKDSEDGYALILGGGGTARAAAYAATKLGLEKVYFNRTPEKAQDLADTFGGHVVSSLDAADELKDLDIRVVISTLPAAANFELPEWMLQSKNDGKPIVFDVNYKPYSTKLLEQAVEAGCSVVRGSEMLWEQGVGQFELWTKRTAPYEVMKTVVLDNCLPKEEGDVVDVEIVGNDEEEPFQ